MLRGKQASCSAKGSLDKARHSSAVNISEAPYQSRRPAPERTDADGLSGGSICVDLRARILTRHSTRLTEFDRKSGDGVE
jgi:hypothetical protein